MRRLSVAAIILLLAAPPALVAAADPTPLGPHVTLVAPHFVAIDSPLGTTGRVTMAGAPMALTTVRVYVGAVLSGSDSTDLFGEYAVTFLAPSEPGIITLIARTTGTLPSQSAPVNVRVVAPPSAPLNLSATHDGIHSTVNLTWEPPANNGGATVSGYQIERDDGSGWSLVATTLGRVGAYNDTSADLGETYHYRVRAENFAGLGDAAEATIAMPPYEAATIEYHIPFALVCSDNGVYCKTFLTSSTVTTFGPSVSFRPIAQGRLLTADGEGYGPAAVYLTMNITNAGETHARNEWTDTAYDGTFSEGSDPSVWFYDQAVDECRDITFQGTGTYRSLGGGETTGIRVCRAN